VGRFSRSELEAALETYRGARDAASKSGDWRTWAAVFTEDAHYIEHAYGEIHGRAAIEDWIVKVMAPFPHMRFPQSWVVIDEERDALVFECRNTLDHPTEPGKEFSFPSWTRVIYAGDGLFSYEEDIYNPSRDGPRVIREWLAAGGRLASTDFIDMKHS